MTTFFSTGGWRDPLVIIALVLSISLFAWYGLRRVRLAGGKRPRWLSNVLKLGVFAPVRRIMQGCLSMVRKGFNSVIGAVRSHVPAPLQPLFGAVVTEAGSAVRSTRSAARAPSPTQDEAAPAAVAEPAAPSDLVRDAGAEPGDILIGCREHNYRLLLRVREPQEPGQPRLRGAIDLLDVGTGPYAGVLGASSGRSFATPAELIAAARGGQTVGDLPILNGNALQIVRPK
ncbi:MAG: hypothetical protein RLZZ387_3506 [Chloroflexota bacterium]|jgi:hypothetical protein